MTTVNHLTKAFQRLITQYNFDVITRGLNPLERDPTGAFATWRLTGCESEYIMRIHRDSDDTLIDVYDFKQYEAKYKTSSGGSWVDMTGDIYYVDTWYNQSVPGLDMYQTTKTKKPLLVPNVRNGRFVLRYDGTSNYLESIVNASNFVTVDTSIVFAGYKPTGTPTTIGIPNTYLLQMIVGEKDAWFGLMRGISTPYGPNDSIFTDFQPAVGPEIAVMMEAPANNWYNAVSKHSNASLIGYLNGELIGSVAAGTMGGGLGTPLVMGHHPWQSAYLNGDVDQVYTFNQDVMEADILAISLFMEASEVISLNNIKAMIKAFIEQVQDIEDSFQIYGTARSLDTAIGEQLDGWGKLLDVDRGQDDDETFRGRLKIKLSQMYSEGTIENLLTIFNSMAQPVLTELVEYFPAGFSIHAFEPDPIYEWEYIRAAMIAAKCAGVEICELIYTETFPAFAFSEYPGGYSAAGFDDGTGTVGGYFSTAI